MWLEELTLENIRCFEKATMKFSEIRIGMTK
jgi:hypothetical protein